MATDHDEDLVPVKLPSGATFWVYRREKGYFDERVKRYQADNSFSNISDLQTLDMIISLELMSWRWAIWVSQQTDYWMDPVDEKELNEQIKKTSTELRQLKSSLGIDKVTRDKARGEDSVAHYISELRQRAKEFGYMRNEQAAKAIELWKELEAKMQLFQNCTPDERREMKADWDHVMEWVIAEAIPQFNDIDDKFRQTSQRYWIRKQ